MTESLPNPASSKSRPLAPIPWTLTVSSVPGPMTSKMLPVPVAAMAYWFWPLRSVRVAGTVPSTWTTIGIGVGVSKSEKREIVSTVLNWMTGMPERWSVPLVGEVALRV